MTPIDWPKVWTSVAAGLAAHRAAGRGHLLTEDTLRLESVLALQSLGVTPERLQAEVLVPELAGGKLDLVVDPPAGTVIELKYPRDSRTGFSPDTMTFGEILRDFLRVAAVPANDRWVVQVLNDRLAAYLAAAHGRAGMTWAHTPNQRLELAAATVAALPATAVQAIGAAAQPGTVTATCRVTAPVGAGLTLYAYEVDGFAPEDLAATPAAGADPAAAGLAEPTPVLAPVVPAATGRGARQEILEAARAVITRAGRPTFTMPDVIGELRRRGSGYAEQTVRTMIAAHLCADATGDGVAAYTDFTRVGRGTYRFTESYTP